MKLTRLVLTGAVLACIRGSQPSEAAVAPRPPKLLLAVVIDQFRYDYLTRFRDDYRGGLARLLREGAVFTAAHHTHALTETAVGHSVFLSGATPSVSGIVANEWFDRASGKRVTSVSDDGRILIGGSEGKAASSPDRYMVDTVGDQMKIAGKTRRVIGVSLKDRAAILPAGHMADAAYWFDNGSGHFVTSTYYRNEMPEWAQRANAAEPAKSFAAAVWTAVDAKPGAAPFCSMSGTPAPKCASIEASPWGNEMIETFAEAAIKGEELGTHPGTDILSVSFSSNDYVGHAKGPDSPEVRDMALRVDRLLGKLMSFIDARIGAGNTLVVLTADHGVAPVPRVSQERKIAAGNVSPKTLAEAADSALDRVFGPADWFLPSAGAALDYAVIAERKLDPVQVRRVAAEAMRGVPNVARVYTAEDLAQPAGDTNDPVLRAARLSYYAGRSPDLHVIPRPYFQLSSYSSGTTHGTPWGYDSHVPVIFAGPGIRAGVYRRWVGVTAIAPTLAAYFGVEPPSGAFDDVLREALADEIGTGAPASPARPAKAKL